MATWNFAVENGTVAADLVVTDGDYQPRGYNFNAPTYDLLTAQDRIKIYEFGKYRRSFTFSEIGTIGGETPTDLEDAFSKLKNLLP